MHLISVGVPLSWGDGAVGVDSGPRRGERHREAGRELGRGNQTS